MSIQTDNFDLSDLQPSKRVISAVPASPQEEAVETIENPASLRVSGDLSIK